MEQTIALDRALRPMLGRLTADLQERRNVFWMTVAYVLYGGSSAFYGGELWSGFLVKTGFSLAQIGVITAAGTFGLAREHYRASLRLGLGLAAAMRDEGQEL